MKIKLYLKEIPYYLQYIERQKKYKEEKYICLKIYPIEYKNKYILTSCTHRGDMKKKIENKIFKNLCLLMKNEIKY